MAITVYTARLTIPAATPATAPVEQALRVAPGKLTRLRLIVPPGPRGEVSLWLLHQRSQVAPVPPGRWEDLDDDIVEYPLQLDLGVNETDLTLVGISPTASFQHVIDFECLVDTEPISTTAPGALTLPERVLEILGF